MSLNLASQTDYAGDLSPREAYELLGSDPAVQLVDVRTQAEWNFVGVVDLSHYGKASVLVEWQEYPTMARNPSFVSQVEGALEEANEKDADTGELNKSNAIVFLCRSGVRSVAAAQAMTASGYEKCFNVTEGFEGDLDAERRRGGLGGWKMRDLPWIQR